MNAFSLHSYGKTGLELFQLANSTQVAIDAARQAPVTQAKIPFIITEHAAHTTASWNSLSTTQDTPAEASRLAAQLLYMTSGAMTAQQALPFSVTFWTVLAAHA